MLTCRVCQSPVPGDGNPCPTCGAGLGDEDASTIYEGPRPLPPQARRLPGRQEGETRFVPGALLSGRYRIVAPLGRGGMGEVFRAEDLRLRQPVALKFLPERLVRDRLALARFHEEVRVARQISHPNVCRVFDIQDAEGQPFLAMEYIDGEDLAALLRRIGRLPVDKGLEIAKQLCAGLAAIHDSGVLHRDLKPANIMIDARGRARITDFGISALAEDVSGGPSRIGTPAYMAPEQLAGGEVTVRTDLYALGLILYEVLTGQRPDPGARKPLTPSALVREIDPRTETALLRCLERDPASRPASALALALALPGRDPLAAAMAAGETPSPEMVAANPTTGALKPAQAVAGLAAVVLLSAVLVVAGRLHNVSWRPLERSPEIMADRAREILSRLGYPDPPLSRAFWYAYVVESLHHQRVLLQSGRVKEAHDFAEGRAPLAVFVYRESPRPLLPYGPVISGDDPPVIEPGEALVWLDVKGRLLRLRVVPTWRQEDRASAGTDWQELFSAAHLAPEDLVPAEPEWLPAVFADRRQAWTGVLRDSPRKPFQLRIEACSYRGAPVSFERMDLWPDSPRPEIDHGQSPRVGILRGLFYFFYLTVAIVGVLLARRHWRLQRGDAASALRFASLTFVLNMATSLILASRLWNESGDLFWINALGRAFVQGAIVWICYMGLEPILRRNWPERIVSWSRLLGGNFRDPIVGRDVLVGGVLGLAISVVFTGGRGLIQLASTGGSQIVPGYPWISASPHFLPHLLSIAVNALLIPLCFLVFLLVVRLLLRRSWAASVTVWFLLTVVLGLRYAASGWLQAPATAELFWMDAAAAAFLFVLAWTRFGLLAGVVQWLTQSLGDGFILLPDLSSWYAGRGLFALVTILGIATYGFVVSTAGQRWFRDEILDR